MPTKTSPMLLSLCNTFAHSVALAGLVMAFCVEKMLILMAIQMKNFRARLTAAKRLAV